MFVVVGDLVWITACVFRGQLTPLYSKLPTAIFNFPMDCDWVESNASGIVLDIHSPYPNTPMLQLLLVKENKIGWVSADHLTKTPPRDVL